MEIAVLSVELKNKPENVLVTTTNYSVDITMPPLMMPKLMDRPFLSQIGL